MFSRKAETRYKKLWFGLFARVTIGPWFLHKSGIGPLPIPHPSLANRLLRQGLPDDLSDDLSFAHEFAHLQTAPLILLYMLAILLLVHARGRVSLTVVLIVLASVQAAWEIVSEGLVILQDPVRYRMSYAAVTMLPRVLFWAAGGVFTAAGTRTIASGRNHRDFRWHAVCGEKSLLS